MKRASVNWTVLPALLMAVGCGGAKSASTTAAEKGHAEGRQYLALGDSIAYGFSPLISLADPTRFVGYPETVSTDLTLDDVNASCPGETSGSFLSATAPDNGCRFVRAHFPLHVSYTGTQMDYAMSVLTDEHSGKHERVVTIDIGGNDLLILARTCAGSPACIGAHLPSVLAAYGAHLGTILENIRVGADYTGPLVVMNLYTGNYRDPLTVGVTGAFNRVTAAVAAQFDAPIADAFAAFGAASAATGGDACAAGLLIQKPTGGCDVHPSPAGRDLLAHSVESVLPSRD